MKSKAESSHSSAIMPGDAGKSSPKTRQAAFSQCVTGDKGNFFYTCLALLYSVPFQNKQAQKYWF